MTFQNKIYIVLPAFNEEVNLGKLLSRFSQAMKDASISNYEVIVVDDGSKDNTVNIAKEFQNKMPVILEVHPQNMGLGLTIRDGIYLAASKASDEDLIVTMDADETQPPEIIGTIVEKIEQGYDVVIASRYRKGSEIHGVDSHRLLFSYVASWLFRILFPTRGVRDYTCGYRAYKAKIIKAALAKYGNNFIDQTGFQVMVDILLKLRKMKVVFGEVPFILRYDFKGGASKMKVFKTIRNTIKLIFSVR